MCMRVRLRLRVHVPVRVCMVAKGRNNEIHSIRHPNNPQTSYFIGHKKGKEINIKLGHIKIKAIIPASTIVNIYI